jgi:hypothetical protein
VDRSLSELTIETWQSLSPVPLTEADAAEIVDDFMGFVSVLRRWKTAESSNA